MQKNISMSFLVDIKHISDESFQIRPIFDQIVSISCYTPAMT